VYTHLGVVVNELKYAEQHKTNENEDEDENETWVSIKTNVGHPYGVISQGLLRVTFHIKS
ncbi:hypothetical protein OFC03_28535, partial [Escherichia coli]|nr:hypothetical protein [Escherichia coli]